MVNEKNRTVPDGPIVRINSDKALVLAEVLAESAQRVQASGGEFAQVLRMLDCDVSPIVARLVDAHHPLPPASETKKKSA